MSLFDDIQTLEQQVSDVLQNTENYKSINNFRDAYTEAILQSFGDFSNEELSTVDIDEVVKQALRDSADFIDEDLAAQIDNDVNTIVNNTMDFYNEQNITMPNILEAVERTEDAQRLADTFRTNMGEMRDELLDQTIDTLKKAVGRGDINRASMADEILEAADGNLHHARTNARMIVSSYNRIGRNEVRKDAELEHGYYYGDKTVNTRTFCLRCLNRVFSLKQIKALDNGQGLDVKIHCGGWNCIHSWLWMEPEWDPELQERFDSDQLITEEKDSGLDLKVPET